MFFDLKHHPGPGQIMLGDLAGRTEISVSGTGAFDAIRLLDSLLADHPASILGPGDASKMSVSDRDRAMALLHMSVFGRRIAGDGKCTECDGRYDFDFDLGDLVAAIAPGENTVADEVGWIETEEGIRFRLPTGDDEMAAAGLDAEAASNVIALRCVAAGAASEDLHRISEAAQRIAPLVDLTLDATCPECGTVNQLAFAAERYFLSSILRERRRLLREIHLIALTYGWSYDAIVDLPRAHRRELISQIDRDRDATLRARAR